MMKYKQHNSYIITRYNSESYELTHCNEIDSHTRHFQSDHKQLEITQHQHRNKGQKVWLLRRGLSNGKFSVWNSKSIRFPPRDNFHTNFR